MVSWIVIQTERAEHLRSRAVSRRSSVGALGLSRRYARWGRPYFQQFFGACPAESGLIVAGSLFKLRGIEDLVVAAIAELCCAYALRAAI